MHFAWYKRLRLDVKYYWKALAAAGSVCLLLQLIFHTVCPMRLLTGFPCPGCGMTRALIAFFSGDFHAAWHYHPLFPAIPAGMILFFYCRYVNPARFRIFRIYAILATAAMLAVYSYRMFTLFPNTEPMLYYKNDVIPLKIRYALQRLCAAE